MQEDLVKQQTDTQTSVSVCLYALSCVFQAGLTSQPITFKTERLSYSSAINLTLCNVTLLHT